MGTPDGTRPPDHPEASARTGPADVVSPRRRRPPEAQSSSTATAALPRDGPRRERQPPPASPAREGLRPAVTVPEAVAAGQHDALAAAPVRAGEHDPLPGVYASGSHAPSVTSVACHVNLNPRFTNRAPEVEPFAFAGVGLLPERTGTQAADATPEKARAPARPRGRQEGPGAPSHVRAMVSSPRPYSAVSS
jgi:hypothetical protein